MASPCFIGWHKWEPSVYIIPSLQNQMAPIDWPGFTNPCIREEEASKEIGSLTIYWRSRDRIGTLTPPAESIAAVDPAAVETRRPLDRQFTSGVQDWPSCLSLPGRGKTIMLTENTKQMNTSGQLKSMFRRTWTRNGKLLLGMDGPLKCRLEHNLAVILSLHGLTALIIQKELICPQEPHQASERKEEPCHIVFPNNWNSKE